MKLAVRIVDEKRINNDTNHVLGMIDELSAAALNITNGAQGYNNFIQVRDDFKNYVKNVNEGYNILELK